MCTNVRSLLRKMEEQLVMLCHLHVDVAAITETWLHHDIDNDLIQITNYNLFRQDRPSKCGGGVCAFVSTSLPYKRWFELENASFECLRLWLRPHRLPRSITGIVVGVLYNLPDKSMEDQHELIRYFIECLDCTRNKYPDCGIFILGDFKNLNIFDQLNGHNLCQIVNSPTRGPATLDLNDTNMKNFYQQHSVLPPIDISNHNVIYLQPKHVSSVIDSRVTRSQYRCFPKSACEAFGGWLTSQDWNMNTCDASVEDTTSHFIQKLTEAIDIFFPLRTAKFHSIDKPWMTASIKQLINERQWAYFSGNTQLWHHYKK